MLQRLVGHDRTKVGAADADIDDVANSLARVALPLAAADAIGKCRHLVEHGVDLGNNVLAVGLDGFAFRRAQGDVQHRPLLRDVDLVAAKHGIDPRAQARLLGQLQQQLQRFVGDAILRVIEVNPYCLSRQSLPALGVVGEQLAQVKLLDLLVVCSQGFPCVTTLQILQSACHLAVPFTCPQCASGSEPPKPFRPKRPRRGKLGAPAPLSITGSRQPSLIPVRLT